MKKAKIQNDVTEATSCDVKIETSKITDDVTENLARDTLRFIRKLKKDGKI